MERCTELEESEATYSKAISKNVATQSLQCAMLCQEHMEHMRELETCALKVENKSGQHFLLAHQAVLHEAPPSLKEISILLTPFYWDHHHHPINPLSSPQHLRQKGSRSPLFLSNQNPNIRLCQRGNINQWMHRKTHQWMKISPQLCMRNC